MMSSVTRWGCGTSGEIRRCVSTSRPPPTLASPAWACPCPGGWCWPPATTRLSTCGTWPELTSATSAATRTGSRRSRWLRPGSPSPPPPGTSPSGCGGCDATSRGSGAQWSVLSIVWTMSLQVQNTQLSGDYGQQALVSKCFVMVIITMSCVFSVFPRGQW